ncbi:DUF4105 domain-containing protein [Ahniella affigens]|nr:DUF4105 domain-containing protein [Ahniella affigens]
MMFAVIVLAYGLRVLGTSPSNARDWSPDQARLAGITSLDPDRVRISNIRNARYRTSQDYELRWESREYDLSQVDSLWYVVEPFADWRGPAHSFLSFGFSNGQYLAVSVEIRKEQGESFSPWLGLVRSYEIIYVLGDERDLIDLRANIRHDAVYLYPIKARPDQIRALLQSMLDRTNALARTPEFYNTLTNSCASNIVDHVNAIWPSRIPFSYRTLLPALSDDLAYDIGLIDTNLPAATYREAHRINDLAAQFRNLDTFSAGIRSRIRPSAADTANASLPTPSASDSFGD